MRKAHEQYKKTKEAAERTGYALTDEIFEKLVEYAERKAKVAGKNKSYVPYLLPDVIKEYFTRKTVNSVTLAAMEFERYFKENTQKQEEKNNGGNYRKTMACQY